MALLIANYSASGVNQFSQSILVNGNAEIKSAKSIVKFNAGCSYSVNVSVLPNPSEQQVSQATHQFKVNEEGYDSLVSLSK